MAQEDSRGLGKTIDFMRAVSILFLVMNIYYFCYPFFHAAGCTNGIVDRILLNFQHDTGLFTSSPVTKCFSLMFLLLDGRQRTEGPGDDMKAYRLLSGSRAIPLLGKRAFPHRRLECSTHHPGVCVRPCRRVHLPAHRRHVDWASFKGTPDG